MRYSLREALAALRRAPVLVGLSATMVAMALFVVGLFGVAAWNLRVALASIEERVEIVAYLRDDARTSEVVLGQEALSDLPAVEEVRLVTKEQALLAAREDLPEFADVFSGLDENPLPASLEIRLREGSRTQDALEDVAHQAQLYPFVEDVRFGRDWVERLFLLRRIGGFTTAFLGVAFGLVAALIIATAIRIAVFARRDEISIMRLVGARNGLIRRPFLLEGAVTGMVGALLAVALTFLSHELVTAFLFDIEFIPVSWVLLGVLSGALFGVVASAWAVRRYLREV